MRWRGASRRLLLYSIVAVGGFLLAYLIVAFLIFPAAVVPDEKPVPNVVGLDYDSAARKLEKGGFGAVVGESRPNTRVPASIVLDQLPVAGSREKPGTQVALNVSAGQRVISVPNVVGRARQLAELELTAQGLQLGAVTERESTSPRGEVLETRPRVGENVPPATTVSLVVSGGPSSVEVPDVVGQSIATARSILEQLGLRVGSVEMDTTTSGNMGVVTKQSPPAGTRVRAGARIGLRRG